MFYKYQILYTMLLNLLVLDVEKKFIKLGYCAMPTPIFNIFSSDFKWALLKTHLLSFNMTALNSNWPNLDMYIVVKTPKGQP